MGTAVEAGDRTGVRPGHRRWWALAIVLLLAAALRAWAVYTLPVDYDEPTYLEAAYYYADVLHSGDLNGVIDYPNNREHPALPKLLYGLVILVQGDGAPWEDALAAARVLAAAFGVLAVLVLALVDPLAGGLLAVHTMAVKYTSQVYLEALPMLAALVAVSALRRAERSRDRWFWLSAVALGVMAAGKLSYAPVGAAILALAWEKRICWSDVLLHFAVAAAVFFVLNPTLWHQPVQRLGDMLFFHVSYSQGARVEIAGYPWHQPFTWLSSSPPAEWHPTVFFYFGFDGAIFWLAVAGLKREWRERRWLVIWIFVGVAVLLAWPTKWPQYTLAVTPALILVAAASLRSLRTWLREHEGSWDWVRLLVPRVSPLLAALLVGCLLAIVAWYAIYRADIAAGQRGWRHLTASSGALPSNTVYDIAPLADGRVFLATERGLVLWSPGSDGESGAATIFDPRRGGHAPSRMLDLALDASGALWVGGEEGLRVFTLDDAGRPAWRAVDLETTGLPDGRVTEVTSSTGGDIWIGADVGAARFDGDRWQAYTSADSGLGGERVTSIAAAGDDVWFGTEGGVSRLDVNSGEWRHYDTTNSGLRSNSVSAVAVDGEGTIWAGTLGGGLSVFDGAAWRTYLASNSALPLNAVTALTPAVDGGMWVGASFAGGPGGMIAYVDGESWSTFAPGQTGFSGSEPLAMASSSDGEIWIGTRTAGVDVFRPEP